MTPRDKLWELAYVTFETRPGSGFRTEFSSQGSTNEVQFRMMRNIAQLRDDKHAKVDRRLVGNIAADVLVAEAMGWMSKQTSQKMQDLIDEILEEE